MLEVAVLYGCDLSQVFTPIILRLYQPHSLCEKGATKAAAKAALYVFLLAPLREGRLKYTTRSLSPLPVFLLAPLREGRHFLPEMIIPVTVFLLTPLREGRQEQHRRSRERIQFLLAPLREGRPSRPVPRSSQGLISTHAPTRGAT